MDIPDSVTIPAGFNLMSFPFNPLGPGMTTLTATLAGAQRIVTLTFVNNPSVSSVSIEAKLLSGAATSLMVSTDVAPAQDTSVALTSSNTSALALPPTLLIPAGQTSATIPLTGGVTGTTLITAGLNGSSASALVSVVAHLSLDSIGDDVTLEAGAVASLTAILNVAAETDKTVSLSITPPGIVSGPGTVVFPAGSTFASYFLQALAPGNALVQGTLDGVTRQVVMKVVDHASVESLFGFASVGGTSTITISLDAQVAADTVVTITNTDSTAFTTPASVIVEAGRSSVAIPVLGLAAVPTTITATLGASSANTTITPSP